MVSKDVVVEYLQLLLEGADPESTSEDSLKRMLKAYFIQDTSQFDADVQEEIQKYICLQSQVRIHRGKRFREDDEHQARPTAKKVKTAESRDPAEGNRFYLTEDGRIRCVVRHMQGNHVVEIRVYSLGGGNMIPTREGVHLTRYEWAALSSSSHSLLQALKQGDLSHSLPLGPSRVVTLAAASSGAVSVAIPAGDSIPGNPEAPLKGIHLSASAFHELTMNAESVNEALTAHSSHTTAQQRMPDAPMAPPASMATPASTDMPVSMPRPASSAMPASLAMPASMAMPARMAMPAPLAQGAAPMAPRHAHAAPGVGSTAPRAANAAPDQPNMPPIAVRVAPGASATAPRPAFGAPGAVGMPPHAAMAPGAVPRPAKRKRVRSKRHKPGGAAAGAPPGGAPHPGAPPQQYVPRPHAAAVPAAPAARPAAPASGSAAAPTLAPPATRYTASAYPAPLPAFNASAPSRPFDMGYGRPAAPGAAAPSALAPRALVPRAGLPPPPPSSAPPAAMRRTPPPPSHLTVARPAPGAPVDAAGTRPAHPDTAASSAGAPAAPPAPAASGAAHTACTSGRTAPQEDLAALERTAKDVEAACEEVARNRNPETLRRVLDSFEDATRDIAAAFSDVLVPAASAAGAAEQGGAGAQGDALAAFQRITAAADLGQHAPNMQGLPAQVVEAAKALEAGVRHVATELAAQAPAQATHKAGDQLRSASGGGLWALGVRTGPEQMCVHVHREKGHVMVSLGPYREKDGRWSPVRRGVTLNLEQFNGIVVSHKRVSGAVRAHSNMETRMSPEWRLFVMHHQGKTNVSMRRASDAAKTASRRGAKGVTLTGDEWLMLDGMIHKVKAAIGSLKERIKQQLNSEATAAS